MKRYGEFVRTDVLYKHRPGVYGIIIDRDNILLTHQDLPDDEIQLPGGGIDPGEGAVQALHRECREETGWKVSIERRLGAYQRFTYMSEYGFWAQKICHIYLCRPVLKLHEPLEPMHTTLWTTPVQALDLLDNEGDRDFLAAYLLN